VGKRKGRERRVGERREKDTCEKRLKRNAKRLSGSPGGAETNGGAQSSGVPGLPLSIEFCVDVSGSFQYKDSRTHDGLGEYVEESQSCQSRICEIKKNPQWAEDISRR
jgi:hypothetical protein